jgi:hypothetical protein
MATSVTQLETRTGSLAFSIVVTDSDGDKIHLEILRYGVFFPPDQSLPNGVSVPREDVKVILQVMAEVFADEAHT